jgi:hypothetical protein
LALLPNLLSIIFKHLTTAHSYVQSNLTAWNNWVVEYFNHSACATTTTTVCTTVAATARVADCVETTAVSTTTRSAACNN